MGLDESVEKMQLRQSYRNIWRTNLLGTISADTPFCCFALVCGPCASYMMRKRALYGDMSRYIRCAGYVPCSGKCGERNCPEVCLCTEVFCCFANSVASTRFLLQDEFNIQTTPCDNCIIGFMMCLQQLACICSLIACISGIDEIGDLANMLSCLADLVFCSLVLYQPQPYNVWRFEILSYLALLCFGRTQHKIEMDKRDGKFGPPTVMAAPPPMQQMSRVEEMPPHSGFPPQPQPVYGQPPPPFPGYPPAGFPPPPLAYPPPPPPPPVSYPLPPPPPSGAYPLPHPVAYSPPPPPPPGAHVAPPPPPAYSKDQM